MRNVANVVSHHRFTLQHLVGLSRFFLKRRYGFGLKRLYRQIDQARRANS